MDSGVVASSVKLLMAQKLLEENKGTEAEVLLKQAIQNFKDKEDDAKTLEAELLLAECSSLNSMKTISNF